MTRPRRWSGLSRCSRVLVLMPVAAMAQPVRTQMSSAVTSPGASDSNSSPAPIAAAEESAIRPCRSFREKAASPSAAASAPVPTPASSSPYPAAPTPSSSRAITGSMIMNEYPNTLMVAVRKISVRGHRSPST